MLDSFASRCGTVRLQYGAQYRWKRMSIQIYMFLVSAFWREKNYIPTPNYNLRVDNRWSDYFYSWTTREWPICEIQDCGAETLAHLKLSYTEMSFCILMFVRETSMFCWMECRSCCSQPMPITFSTSTFSYIFNID